MIFKLVIFILAAYFLYRLFMNDNKKRKNVEKAEEKKRVAAGEMVQDPICGAYVDKESAISVRDGDKVIYFCSYECRGKYLEQIKDGKN